MATLGDNSLKPRVLMMILCVMDKPSYLCTNEGCDNYVENKDTGLCASCSHSNRDTERKAQKDAAKVKKPIKKESDKRKRERPIYNKMAKEQLAEHSECQIKILGVCTGKATENHHSAKRGKNYLNKEFFMSACTPCHEYVERVMSAKERREKGFLK